MATKEASGRKIYSPEDKAEAIRLLSEEGYTLQQAADHIGCNVNSIQKWKTMAKSGKPGKKRRKKRTHAVKTAIAEPSQSFDEFVQDYWSGHKDAADVLQLPPDLAPKAVQYVNNVLRYAYDQLGGQ